MKPGTQEAPGFVASCFKTFAHAPLCGVGSELCFCAVRFDGRHVDGGADTQPPVFPFVRMKFGGWETAVPWAPTPPHRVERSCGCSRANYPG
jgi:hypothetical protein